MKSSYNQGNLFWTWNCRLEKTDWKLRMQSRTSIWGNPLESSYWGLKNQSSDIKVLNLEIIYFYNYKNMGKTESIWHFWEFTAVNSWYRNASGTTEVTEIFRFESRLWAIGVGKYHWINRPWQRYDYESSLSDALDDLLDSISWKQYEEWKEDIDKIRLALKKMENYEGAPRN